MLRTEISGECMIFRSEYNGRTYYNTSLSKKINGEWKNASIGIDLGKDADIATKSKIRIIRATEEEMPNATLDFYGEEKKPTLKIKVWKWELISTPTEAPQEIEGFTQLFAQLEDDSDSIPF